MRPASSGSLLKSMPGTTCAVQNATCSVSAKKLSGFRFEHHASHRRQRYQFLRDQLGGIEHVEAEAFGLLLGEELERKFPFRVLAGLDRFPQVATVEVGVGAGDLDRLVPHQRVRAQLGRPVELDEGRLALLIDEAEGVHAEALHHAEAARDRSVRHHPGQHVRRFGHQRDEVPERVVRRCRLRDRVVRFRLYRMHQVRKLHRILDEEHRDVVAHEIPVAFVGVELDGKAAHVARGVDRAALAGHGGEAHEHRRALAGLAQTAPRASPSPSTRSTRSSRARPSRVRARCARGCAHGRSG